MFPNSHDEPLVIISGLVFYRCEYYGGGGGMAEWAGAESSSVGTTFAIIPVAEGAWDQLYSNGKYIAGPIGEGGVKLPCPDGYGAILGTASLCALLQISLSFMPPRRLRKIFPFLGTGPAVTLVGVKLIAAGFKNWAGGSGPCASMPARGLFSLCHNTAAPHPLLRGSAEFIGKFL
ncbi:hypothetical protein HOY80DRAFT_999666 [Tuber brumale]|nr:hypothetical protein HOY80DRAFT_999665 [Tuber brumale]KAG0641057.1 hypothetical protein HOY80DRAFT_999666 [Tuber brumale]